MPSRRAEPRALAALIVAGAAVPGNALWAALGRESFREPIGLHL